MPTSHSDLAVEKADLRGVIQALRYNRDEGVQEVWCGRRGQRMKDKCLRGAWRMSVFSI